ncbi:3-isopropylmalate/(R)-2-methylmalate dehydratase small subunit [Herbaspirillum sp. Sphag1AN]|uniref:3-isopropylmalate dehydratase small subunit n=1 Tax=unclassified Herbaspirillum TaxID=2624150 RepID=UPI00161B5644|nr:MULTISPECIES: 3-isopropylmalate dehydratase small subunit [unclassified Herbaspirillum]MBB3211625.1 3-isopropylmalate/(R)-2-methylmalate dehydratase small subunit [Herbaspirillum sp. Sphag1AN]MBB3245107.1 3-isopropylmalate/(R)-2-methylmalate dehydratase small subunit [Herbaspirillum sp. Sphag64]
MSEQHTVAGIAAPLPLNNLDTDQIMPKQFLLGIDKSGLAGGLLYDLRMDGAGLPRPEFVLNQPHYQHARILIGGTNFGCGSSREHAVWGLQQAGFEAVIAPSFGEIFYFNALNNRLLLIMLEPQTVAELMARVARADQSFLTIDVQAQSVLTSDGATYHFALPERQKRMFIEGRDMIGMTLRDSDAIAAFETRHHAAHPWMRINLPLQQA